jgi:O-antigen ligase
MALLGLLAFAGPVTVGGTEAWGQQILAILSLLALVVAVFFRWKHGQALHLSAPEVLVALFFAWVLLQLLPLPLGMLAWISPVAEGHWREAIRYSPDPSAPNAPVSLVPSATRAQLASLLTVVGAFLATRWAVDVEKAIRDLLRVLTAIGLTVAAAALAAMWFGDGRVWGLVRPADAPATGGLFVSRGHLSQYLALILGAAAGVLLHEISRNRSRFRSAWFWLSLLTGIAGLCAVVVSGSRAGVLAIAVSGLIVLPGYVGGRRAWAVLLGAPALLGLLAVLGLLGLMPRFSERWREAPEVAIGGRDQILRDLLPAWRDFPLTGSGLGTFPQVFPTYQSPGIVLHATHAENEYAQILLEAGWPGLLLALGFVLLLVRAWWWGKSSSDPGRRGLAAGVGLGVFAILLHSTVDFGQHLPGIACVSAILFGVLLNLRRLPGRRLPVPELSGRASSILGGLLGAAVLIGLVWAIGLSDAARRAEYWSGIAKRQRDELQARGWEGTDAEFVRLLRAAGAAQEAHPDDPDLLYQLNFARWISIAGRGDLTYAPRIAMELERSFVLAPTFGLPWSLAGQIRSFRLNEEAGDALIRRSAVLWPGHPEVALAAGELELLRGDLAAARGHFSKILKLGEQPSRLAASVLSAGRHPELLLELVDDGTVLLEQVEPLRRRGQNELAERVLQKATDLLVARARLREASSGDFRSARDALLASNQPEKALEFARLAVKSDPTRAESHATEARILWSLDRRQEAAECLRAALTMDPGNQEYARILREWTGASDR